MNKPRKLLLGASACVALAALALAFLDRMPARGRTPAHPTIVDGEPAVEGDAELSTQSPDTSSLRNVRQAVPSQQPLPSEEEEGAIEDRQASDTKGAHALEREVSVLQKENEDLRILIHDLRFQLAVAQKDPSTPVGRFLQSNEAKEIYDRDPEAVDFVCGLLSDLPVNLPYGEATWLADRWIHEDLKVYYTTWERALIGRLGLNTVLRSLPEHIRARKIAQYEGRWLEEFGQIPYWEASQD